MWYLIAIVAAVLMGLFVYASVMKNKRAVDNAKTKEKPSFRTEEDLSSYSKPMDGRHTHVDFDDVE